ncbi:MAG: HesA/MoeB/ThiF family protein [Bacillota bacterium]
MENRLYDSVGQAARQGVNPAGEGYRFLTLPDSIQLAERLRLPRAIVEQAALEQGIIPERYQRSIGTIGTEGQLRLLRSKVGIVGAGGLGGYAVELLARMGVGRLVVIDGDTFTDSNLNRQLLAVEKELNWSKAGAAARRVKEINGAVEVTSLQRRGDAFNLADFLDGCDLALDCLDNLSTRFALEEACGLLNIPLVHGAIAGFMGQLAVIRPGRPLFAHIYGAPAPENSDQGVETTLGNPAFTPAMLAAWQVGEAVKILAGLDGALTDKLLIIDMFSGACSAVTPGDWSPTQE